MPDSNGPLGRGLHKRFLFHPVLTIDAHEPVGQTQQFRRFYYAQQAHARLGLFQEGREPLNMPWGELGDELFGLSLPDDKGGGEE